jgi:hypothetical protein
MTHNLPIKFPDPQRGPSLWRALLLIAAHEGFKHISQWIFHQVTIRWGELYPGMMFPDEQGVIRPMSYTDVKDQNKDVDYNEKEAR